jgi:hypothetical protein
MGKSHVAGLLGSRRWSHTNWVPRFPTAPMQGMLFGVSALAPGRVGGVILAPVLTTHVPWVLEKESHHDWTAEILGSSLSTWEAEAA